MSAPQATKLAGDYPVGYMKIVSLQMTPVPSNDVLQFCVKLQHSEEPLHKATICWPISNADMAKKDRTIQLTVLKLLYMFNAKYPEYKAYAKDEEAVRSLEKFFSNA